MKPIKLTNLQLDNSLGVKSMRFNPNSGHWEKTDEDYAEDEGTERIYRNRWVVVDSRGRFMAQGRVCDFVSEFPDAEEFDNCAQARHAAMVAIRIGNSGPVKVVRNYGMDNETVDAELA